MLQKVDVKDCRLSTFYQPDIDQGCLKYSTDFTRTWSCNYVIISSYYLECIFLLQYRVDFKMFLIRGLLWLSILRLLTSQAEQNILMMKYNDNFLQVFVKCCEGALCWFTFLNLEHVPWVLMLIPSFLNRHYWNPQLWSLSHMFCLYLVITFLSEFLSFPPSLPASSLQFSSVKVQSWLCYNNFANLCQDGPNLTNYYYIPAEPSGDNNLLTFRY